MSDKAASPSSYRQILTSSSIVGGASLINIAGGLVRQKAAALILGPAGVGLIGLLQSFVTTTGTLGALGLPNAGTRQIAQAVGRSDEQATADARRALILGTAVLAALAATIVWVFREPLATHVLGRSDLGWHVGWLSLAVALTIVTSSQVAVLTGLRRIGDVARVSVISTLAASLLSVAALLAMGPAAIIVFVGALPLASFVVAQFYLARLPRSRLQSEMPALLSQWREMVPLGAALMAGGVIGLVAQLAVRVLVQRSVGLEQLGYYQAAATLAVTYVGFVLSAMGTDYYPRLSSAMTDPQAANRLVNEQTEVALMLGGPVLLLMLGGAPLVLHLLYAAEFRSAAEVLRWQVMGDAFKLAAWPLGFLILAAGDGRKFLATELLGAGVIVAVTWIALPYVGTVAAGIASAAAFLVYLPVVYLIGRAKTGFHWTPRVARILVSLLVLTGMVFAASRVSEWAAIGTGLVAAAGFGGWSLTRLRALTGGRLR